MNEDKHGVDEEWLYSRACEMPMDLSQPKQRCHYCGRETVHVIGMPNSMLKCLDCIGGRHES